MMSCHCRLPNRSFIMMHCLRYCSQRIFYVPSFSFVPGIPNRKCSMLPSENSFAHTKWKLSYGFKRYADVLLCTSPHERVLLCLVKGNTSQLIGIFSKLCALWMGRMEGFRWSASKASRGRCVMQCSKLHLTDFFENHQSQAFHSDTLSHSAPVKAHGVLMLTHEASCEHPCNASLPK